MSLIGLVISRVKEGQDLPHWSIIYAHRSVGLIHASLAITLHSYKYSVAALLHSTLTNFPSLKNLKICQHCKTVKSLCQEIKSNQFKVNIYRDLAFYILMLLNQSLCDALLIADQRLS